MLFHIGLVYVHVAKGHPDPRDVARKGVLEGTMLDHQDPCTRAQTTSTIQVIVMLRGARTLYIYTKDHLSIPPLGPNHPISLAL